MGELVANHSEVSVVRVLDHLRGRIGDLVGIEVVCPPRSRLESKLEIFAEGLSHLGESALELLLPPHRYPGGFFRRRSPVELRHRGDRGILIPLEREALRFGLGKRASDRSARGATLCR